MIGGTGGAERLRALRWAGLAVEIVGYLLWIGVDILFVAAGRSLPWSAATAFTGLCIAGIVLWRRRPGVDAKHVAAVAYAASAAATLTGLVIGQPAMSFGEQLALAVVTVAALRHADDRTTLLLCAGAGIVIVGSPYLRIEIGSTTTAFTILSALGWGGTVAIGLVLREAGSRRASLLERARADERLELARELHDVVAHQVTGIVVAAQAARVVAPADPDVAKALAAIETAGADALAAMRAMVGVLRGGEGGRAPGAELGGIPEMVRRFDPDGTRVRLIADPGFEHAVLPAGVAATGYRVVQEALTNVRRHAPAATRVEVEVRLRSDELVVGVRNDGAHSGSGHPAGFGLAGMAERVGALDGTLHAGPAGNGVWTVTARLPVGGR